MHLIKTGVAALVVAIVVGLAVTLLGLLLVALTVPVAVAVGGFCETWAWVIGLLAGLWYLAQRL